jgi:sulfate/thiosulfate transport system permease protein
MSEADARVMRGRAARRDPFHHGDSRGATRLTLSRFSLRGVALIYLFVLLIAPVGLIFYKTFENGIGPPLEAITSPDGLHAFWLTIVCVGIAVPLNTLFGVITAIVMVRHKFRGKALLNSVIDLPFAISPVVIGLALILIYGQDGWFGGTLQDLGVQVIFSVPGMVLATIFVSLPFVVREVMPVLQEIGTEQEQAAETLGASPWQTFWRVTLPAIRWGVAYGVVLATARALGEFGAVSVVSGKISGETETLPLFVENEYTNFNLAGAYAAAIVLAILALAVLLSMNLLRRNPEIDEGAALFDPAGTNLEKEA